MFCGKIEVCRNEFMAHRTTLEAERPAKAQKAGKKPAAEAGASKTGSQERELIFDAFRRWGYNEATLDPLGFFGPFPQPDLEGLTGDAAEAARRIYCGTIGADFMHLPQPERRRWIAERIESSEVQVDQQKSSRAADSRRSFRAGFAIALSGNEAIFPRGCDCADPAARLHSRHRRRARRR